MKMLVYFLCMVAPIVGFGQTNITYTIRIFPKADKVMQFEKALKLHVQKFRTLTNKWSVYRIQTGPDANGYMIFEEVGTWKKIDSLNKIQLQQSNDWNKNVAIYLTERANNSYFLFRDSLSTVAPTDTAPVIILNHQYPKGGAAANVIDMIKRERKVWIDGNEGRNVYQVANSGAPEFVIVTLLKTGLKDLDNDFGNFVQKFNTLNGAGAWDTFNQDFAKYVERRWNEILYYRSDLTSPN